jgi:protein-tyrosine kinase
MSLVQRAVERLNGASPQQPTAPAAPAPAARPVDPPRAEAPAPPLPPASPPAPGLGHPFTVGRARLRAAGMITPGTPRSRLAEEIRLIKRRLLQDLIVDPQAGAAGRVFMVTSARPSEGKSFIALNLALSLITDENLPVVLVEADVLRPNILNMLGQPPSPGLAELFRDPSVDLADATLHDAMLNLTVIPAGHKVPAGTEFFLGQGMRDLFERLRVRYPGAVILFDSPPVLATTEALTLAHLADAVLLVVEAGRTSRSAVESAIELLAPCRNVGMVLNKLPEFDVAEHFGTYYHDYVTKR